MHQITDPPILYFGTPVVLISTLNCDGTPNLAPMSSAWWLESHAMLGLSARSLTTQNLLRERECVLNLPDVTMVEHVDRIAKTTGSSPVPETKLRRGYRHVADKFGCAELSPIASDVVKPPRAAQCPIQLEATLVDAHSFGSFARALEVRIERVHAEEHVLATPNRINPDEWRPLIMSFQRFYGLTSEQAGTSRLAEIPEESYRVRSYQETAPRFSR